VPSSVKTLFFWLVVGISALLLWQVTKSGSAQKAVPEISYSQFTSDTEAGSIAKVTISGTRARAQYRDGRTFLVALPRNQEAVLTLLHSKGAEVWFRNAADQSSGLQLLETWAPLLILGVLWFYMIRQQQKRAASGKGEAGLGRNP
jgi:cell division protease FtsH